MLDLFVLQSEGQSEGEGLLFPTELRNQRKRLSSAWWVFKSRPLLVDSVNRPVLKI